jgi:hypothetical protein
MSFFHGTKKKPKNNEKIKDELNGTAPQQNIEENGDGKENESNKGDEALPVSPQVMNGGGKGFRVFIKLKPKKDFKDLASIRAKILVIQPDWTFEILRQKIGLKFQMQIVDILLLKNNELSSDDDVSTLEIFLN